MVKVISLKCDWNQGLGPQEGEACIVEGLVHSPEYPEYSFYLLKGYDYKMVNGQRADFNTVFFSIAGDNTYDGLLKNLLDEAKYESLMTI